MINLGFNTTPLNSAQKVRGMGEYAKNLLHELNKLPQLKIEEFQDQKELKNVDLMHFPFFDLFFNMLPLQKKFPTVVTIPDVIPLIYSSQYPKGIKGLFKLNLQKIALKNVKAVITISENSKKDIVKFLKIPPDKIFVTLLAPSSDFKQIKDKNALNKIKAKYNLPDRFVLFGGNINWNKNLLNTVQGCIEANVDIVLRGKGFEKVAENLNHPELANFRQFLENYKNHPKIHIINFVSLEDLKGLYNLSEAVLLTSFYEGFGLPILEAQACGIPVITSNTSSMPEVAGKGALFINPSSVNEIKNAVKNIIENKKLKSDLLVKGYENVKHFSWEKTALETLKIYEMVLR